MKKCLALCIRSDLDVASPSNRLDQYLAAAVAGASSSDKSKINRISLFTLCFKTHLTEYQVFAYKYVHFL